MDIINIASLMQEKTSNNSWFGVIKYIDNDTNWRLLGKYQKISHERILDYCDLRRAASSTVHKIKSIVTKYKKTYDIAKIITLLSYQTNVKVKAKINEDNFISIAEDIKNKYNNFSSTDVFNIYQRKFNIIITSRQQNAFKKKMIIQGKCKNSGLKGNNLTLINCLTDNLIYSNSSRICPVCTLINDNDKQKCEVCLTALTL